MHRLSIRMILFIVVLAGLHITAIAPRKPAAIQLFQEASPRPMVHRDEPGRSNPRILLNGMLSPPLRD